MPNEPRVPTHLRVEVGLHLAPRVSQVGHGLVGVVDGAVQDLVAPHAQVAQRQPHDARVRHALVDVVVAARGKRWRQAAWAGVSSGAWNGHNASYTQGLQLRHVTV